MQTIIDLLDQRLGVPIRARRAELSGEGVVYGTTTTYFNAARREARLKLSIYARTMARAIELEETADALLVRLDESPLTATVTSVVRNGGGNLEDGDWHVRIAYYDIVMRVKRE